MSLATWMTALEDAQETEEFVRVHGARMRCLIAGDGPPVLLLHGLLGTADAWGPATQRLAASSRIYAPDALGIGGSDRVPKLDVSLHATVDRLIELMDAKGVGRADIVGTSHGGSVALMLAALHPERVRSLVLHAPANPFSDIADPLIRFYRTALGRWFASRLPTVPAGVQSLALGRMYGDATRIRNGSLERYIASLRVPGTISYVLSILDRWELDMAALEAALPGVRKVPALLLWGDRDRAVSLRSGERLAEYFDRAALVVIPGAGHLAHEEVPVAFAGAINSFLGGLSRGELSPTANGPRIVTRRAS
ncbi:MAG TPA: alpha/beta hydrolase [Acidobacteriaceae bacterium]|jgi:pimeloyl-ACP methyl ester carboxylesterase|nr:alpha/beta hydrolase [Acidobacteriaceae bacterium]